LDAPEPISRPILASVEAGIGTVTLNRPRQLNALTAPMWRQLADEVRALDSDSAVRVLVVRGSGSRAFSTGADIKEFQANAADQQWMRQYDSAVAAAEEAIASSEKPTIAMIDGHCVGGGCSLAVACDLRLADDTSRFAIPVARMGLVYSLAATRRLVNLVGAAQAKYLLFSARALSAREAFDIGLVNRVVERGTLPEQTESLARTIASGSAHSVRSAKAIVGRVLDGALVDDAQTTRMRVQATASEHYRDAVAAFVEARRPEATPGTA
jgi:enoyl-CoA hydratase/carnithine racemase